MYNQRKKPKVELSALIENILEQPTFNVEEANKELEEKNKKFLDNPLLEDEEKTPVDNLGIL